MTIQKKKKHKEMSEGFLKGVEDKALGSSGVFKLQKPILHWKVDLHKWQKKTLQ